MVLIDLCFGIIVVQADNFKIVARKLHLTSLPASAFDLEIVTEIEPQNNTSLEGLYKSTGNFCTQCEAEGFRKITYFQVLLNIAFPTVVLCAHKL